MPSTFKAGYKKFREKYIASDPTIMPQLADEGQKPTTMVVACCDSRVDPSIILQCNPGDLFVARNVANIIPPFESDSSLHGTSAALEFGICYLNVKHLIILGHSQCGGMHALLHQETLHQNDFLSRWVSSLNIESPKPDVDDLAKQALCRSHENSLTFPWIKSRVDNGELKIHRWFFNIKSGEIFMYQADKNDYVTFATD